MKKLGLTGALILVAVALVIAIVSGYRSMNPPQPDPDRFPKPSPEAMEQIQKMREAYESQR